MAKRSHATAGLAAEGSSRKKRKAAEAAQAKTKQLAGDVSEFDDDVYDGDAFEEGAAIEKVVARPKVHRPEDMPLFAPGLRVFEDFSDTIRNTELAALTKSDPDMDKSRKYGFTLKPLVVTEGALAGKTILVIEETAKFRFMDLPPEVRNLVYGYLIDVPPQLEISTYNPREKPRRVIAQTTVAGNCRGYCSWFQSQLHRAHKRVSYTNSAHSFLRVSKQVLAETGALIYGDSTFSFYSWSDASFFFQTIGNMNRFLRHVQIPGQSKGHVFTYSIIKMLSDIPDLQTILGSHKDLCNRQEWNARSFVGVAKFIRTVTPILQQMQKRMRARGEPGTEDLLEAVKVNAELDLRSECAHCCPDGKHNPCWFCGTGFHGEKECLGHTNCNVTCKQQAKHCQEFEQEVRQAVAKAMKIEV